MCIRSGCLESSLRAINSALSSIPPGSVSSNSTKRALEGFARAINDQCQSISNLSGNDADKITTLTNKMDSSFATLSAHGAFRGFFCTSKTELRLRDALGNIRVQLDIKRGTIDNHSLGETVGPTSQLMLYGFGDCGYGHVMRSFEKDRRHVIEKIFDYKFGREGEICSEVSPPVHKFFSVQLPGSDFKTGLLNMVFENIKRRRAGLPRIPILFLIDKEDKDKSIARYYPPSPSDVINKRSILTMRELRRAYKLCEDPTLIEEIRDVAKQTFCFAQFRERSNFQFKKITAPWDGDSKAAWDEEWVKYKAASLGRPLTALRVRRNNEKRIHGLEWRKQLADAVASLPAVKTAAS